MLVAIACHSIWFNFEQGFVTNILHYFLQYPTCPLIG